MPSLKRVKLGVVSGLYASAGPSQVKRPVETLILTFAGAEGDGHGGSTKPAGVREPAFKRGHRIANMRQISLVCIEELAEIARQIGISHIDPGWIAANVAVEGAGPITQYQPGTIIRFRPSLASIYVTGLNTPCTLAAKMIAKAGGYSAAQVAPFVRSAMGRRGLVGIVYAAGPVSTGDEVETIFCLPELPITD